MYLLGVDAGSTVTKVALYDDTGREIQVANRRIESIHPHTGWVERDMDVVWRQTCDAIREVLDGSSIDPSQVAAVGCTGHGNGAYLLDKSGKPLGHAIHAIDQRATSVLEALTNIGTLTTARRYTHQQAYAGQTAIVLSWLKQFQPEFYSAIGTVLLCKDYINYCLTGQISADFSDMSCTNLMDVTSGEYCSDLLELFDLRDIVSRLPQPHASSSIIGHVNGDAAASSNLSAGTPVIAGMIDLAANAIGTGNTQVGQACIIAGTWSINQVVTETVIEDDEIFLNCFSADPSTYLVVEGSATSTTNLEWYIKQCCQRESELAIQQGKSIYDVCNEMVAEVDIDASKVIFHPFLYASNVNGSATGGFYGLTGWDTQASMLRAIYEGVVFAHLTHIERLRKAGADFKVARFTGGAARSDVWSQMFADAIQVPLEVVFSEETGTLGAALSAGVGVGMFSSIQDAVDQCVVVNRIYQPDPARSAKYLKRYKVFQEIAEIMHQGWALLDEL